LIVVLSVAKDLPILGRGKNPFPTNPKKALNSLFEGFEGQCPTPSQVEEEAFLFSS
jgi:hypothetical protein